MFEATEPLEPLEKRIEDALEYYCTHKVTLWEAAEFHDISSYTTLLYRLHNKTA
jgi:hypothetical protein